MKPVSEVEKLRALLAEAQEFYAAHPCCDVQEPIDRIKAALAEPLEPVECEFSFCNRMNTQKRDSDGRWYCVEHKDAALAEPVEPLRDCICTGPWVTGHRHTDICREFRAMRAECERQTEYGIKQHEVAQDCIREAQKWKKERDDARAEVERLRALYIEARSDGFKDGLLAADRDFKRKLALSLPEGWNRPDGGAEGD